MTKTTTKSNHTTDQDRDCAVFARAALFPPRMHRDVASAHHFPALLSLERLRSQLMRQQPDTTSSDRLFPRRVVVVRNLAASSEDDGGDALQWNGHPDIAFNHASFTVVPNKLSVRCTSECSKLTEFVSQKSLLVPGGGGSGSDNSNSKSHHEIVLCTDRVLQSDYKPGGTLLNPVDLPQRSLQAVEEAVAHQLAKVELLEQTSSTSQQRTTTPLEDAAVLEVQAAKAAECYYSQHQAYGKQSQVRRGSQLSSSWWWPFGGARNSNLYRCIQRVAVQGLIQRNVPEPEAQQAVQQVLEEQEGMPKK